MAYIYVITNDINNKQYVGKTERTIEERFKEHCKDRYRRELENRPLYRAMNKYGIEHFSIRLLEETFEPEVREVYWIDKLNTYNDGYNATYGGDGKHYLDYDLIVAKYKELQNINQVCFVLNTTPKTVRKILKSYNIPIKSSQDIAREKFSIPIAQYTLNDVLIAKYDSITEAAKALGDASKHRHISEVCKGERKTAYGYKWSFLK